MENQQLHPREQAAQGDMDQAKLYDKHATQCRAQGNNLQAKIWENAARDSRESAARNLRIAAGGGQ